MSLIDAVTSILWLVSFIKYLQDTLDFHRCYIIYKNDFQYTYKFLERIHQDLLD